MYFFQNVLLQAPEVSNYFKCRFPKCLEPETSFACISVCCGLDQDAHMATKKGRKLWTIKLHSSLAGPSFLALPLIPLGVPEKTCSPLVETLVQYMNIKWNEACLGSPVGRTLAVFCCYGLFPPWIQVGKIKWKQPIACTCFCLHLCRYASRSGFL